MTPSRHGEGVVVPQAPAGVGLGRLPSQIRISCYCCKRVFPSTGVNGTDLVSCPYCGHEVYVPVAREV